MHDDVANAVAGALLAVSARRGIQISDEANALFGRRPVQPLIFWSH